MLPDLSSHQGVVAIVPAAGSGNRMGTETPKQYLPLGGKSVLEVTIETLLDHSQITLIVLVVPAEDQNWEKLSFAHNERVVVIDGGKERSDSVLNAVNFLSDAGLPYELPVMVHDAARPCVADDDIDHIIDAHLKDSQPKLLAAPVIDTLQKVKDGVVISTEDRDSMVRALTPQVARFIDLKNALNKAKSDGIKITDEVGALIYSGFKVQTVLGSQENIKITHPDDLEMAEFILSKRTL